MKLKTRFYIVVLVILFGFGSIAGLTSFFSYKISRLKKADTLCFKTLETLKHLQVLNAELLYSIELDKTWSHWKIYHKKLQDVLDTLNNAPYIHELLVTPKQKGLLQSLYLFWFSTREKLTSIENSMQKLFLKKDISRDGLIQQYYTTKDYELLAIRSHIMDGSLYLKSDFEVKLAKLVSIIEEETEKQFFNTLALIAIINSAIAIIVSMILISFLAKLKRYLAQLHQSMDIIGKGNFTEKLVVDGNDELSQISLAINMTTDNISVIHKELEERIIEAESANKSKSLFLANMSHELRTPLNAILGFTKIIASAKNINTEQKKSLSIISRSGEHLLALINDILTLSKIEAGGITLNKQKIDLYSLLDDFSEVFRLKARQKKLDFILIRDDELPRYVITDEVKLSQILINLIQNGLKFTLKGHVRLSVFPKKTYSTNSLNQIIQFEVEDTGIGIDKNNYEHIFEVFAQVDPSHEKQEGAGLGLPLSKQYVELMNGDITVASEKDKGTVFTFTIPVKVSPFAVAGKDTVIVKKTEDSLPQDLFTNIPEKTLMDLKHAAVRAEMDNIHAAIKKIEPYNISLANTFSQLANDFAYDRISALLASRKNK